MIKTLKLTIMLMILQAWDVLFLLIDLLETSSQGVEPDPNRIRKPVLTVIIF